MLKVKTPDEVIKIIDENFKAIGKVEELDLLCALGRVLAEDIKADEFIPNFTRSTVDGFAVISKDTFGCSESIPAVLPVAEEIEMGSMPTKALKHDTCVKVPTGGAIPENADAVVMLEYTESYGDGSIGIFKSAAPGSNIIYKGDDAKPGDILLKAGYKITAQDVGSLAAMGIRKVKVAAKPTVGIISTGNELVPSDAVPKDGQIRNVNSDLLAAIVLESGSNFIDYGILKDEESLLSNTLDKALEECDMVLISGGSSAGEKDKTADVIASKGELLFHGIAMKPGKPTILGSANGKAIFGLPGHPVASYFVAKLFVNHAIARITGKEQSEFHVKAILSESLASNHGRAQYGGVKLTRENDKLIANPIHSKSGLITTLAQSDGFYEIDSECEGIKSGDEIEVYVYGI